MSVPFRKVSKTRRNMRRTHYKITANGLVECTNCGAKIRPHRACPKCGFYKGADTSKINLAKIVEDEMTIIIYSKEEILEKYKEENCVCKPCEIINDACINNTDNTTNLININTATKEELNSNP